MELSARSTKISRVDLRYRHLAQNVAPEERRTDQGGPPARKLGRKEEDVLDDAGEPLLVRERKGRLVMGQNHREFHRRAAHDHQARNILTVVVDVIATLDAQGNVVAAETVTPALPAVPTLQQVPPAVPPFPTDLTVPAVPPFPTDLAVPSYPATNPASNPSSQVVISAPVITSTDLTLPSGVPTSLGFNSTISNSGLSISTAASLSLITSLNSTSTTTSSRSSSLSSSRSSLSSTRSSSATTTLSASSRSSVSSSPISGSTASSSPTAVLVPGPGGPAGTSLAPPAATTAAGNSSSDDPSPINTPTVVGSVVGGLAGAAMLLLFLLFLLRRQKQKRRGGALQLSDTATADNQAIVPAGQQMAARSSFVPGAAAAFFNRFSGASASTANTSTTAETGFQRISGRKLPSAFSEGMTSEQFARGGTLSGSSFYHDDHGVYGGPGVIPKEFGKESGEPSSVGAMGTKERIMPSPARTPTIHHPDDAPPFGTSRNGGSTFSPPHSPNPDLPRSTLGRSHPSHDGSRGSRFTENV